MLGLLLLHTLLLSVTLLVPLAPGEWLALEE
jgi:hypothetical protein